MSEYVQDPEDGSGVKPGRSTLKATTEEREEFEVNMAADLIAKNIFVRIYMSVMWLLSTAVFLYYLALIVVQYQQSLDAASSSIQLNPSAPLPLPKVVVCNWNQDGSVANSTPSYNCPVCLLHLASCIDQSTGDSCEELWVHTPIQTAAGLFDCYTFNGDQNNVIWTNITGYSAAIASVWSVMLENATAPPQNRAGCQASFFLPTDTVLPSVIYDEVRFAPTSRDTFFAVTYYNELHQEDNPPADTNISRYDTTDSTVELLNYNQTFGYVGVSFAYENLNMEQAIFFTSFTQINFWADFANMIGILLGLDAIKVASGIPLAVVAIRLKSLNPLEDHFNG